MLPNTRLPHNPTLRVLSYNIRASLGKEPYIGLIQENSIESSLYNCLPYIPRTHGLC